MSILEINYLFIYFLPSLLSGLVGLLLLCLFTEVDGPFISEIQVKIYQSTVRHTYGPSSRIEMNKRRITTTTLMK